MNISREDILSYHLGGKIGTLLTKPLRGPRDLSLAYTPGVAIAVEALRDNPADAFTYTARQNLVAVVSDGTAILGLGDLGATASIPVMEGKAVLFKAFADVDAWPAPLEFCRMNGQCSGKTDVERVIEATARLSCMYGGINLEDIAAPACFEIERRLDEMLDIPVFHDDQWGTAVITLAGVINYCEIAGRKMADLRIVISGAGAAGIRIADMLKDAGAAAITMCDSKGVITPDRTDINDMKRRHAARTAAKTLGEAMAGANVFIGVSAAGCVTPDCVRSMAAFPAIFAMANPTPEILPEQVASALRGKPYVMATGRSDYPNQINNVLGFPYLFRGALDVRAKTINIEMKKAAAQALANLARKPADDRLKALYPDETLEFGPDYIVPKPFDRRLMAEVPPAVAQAAIDTSAARRTDISGYAEQLEKRMAAGAARV
ncbi:MAG: hypothetical protein GX608_05955 [Lentisphaerae bacterium]|nr:hypothetical protein [Lentisphaerota bacterium]